VRIPGMTPVDTRSAHSLWMPCSFLGMDQVVGKREFNTVHLLPLVRHVTFESWACPAVMPAITYSENQALRWQLQNLLQTRVPLTPALNTAASPGATDDPKEPIDVVVTINEVNDRHGTGPLVKRIFHGRRHVFSIRSREARPPAPTASATFCVCSAAKQFAGPSAFPICAMN
jgi:hypothetical protein